MQSVTVIAEIDPSLNPEWVHLRFNSCYCPCKMYEYMCSPSKNGLIPMSKQHKYSYLHHYCPIRYQPISSPIHEHISQEFLLQPRSTNIYSAGCSSRKYQSIHLSCQWNLFKYPIKIFFIFNCFSDKCLGRE